MSNCRNSGDCFEYNIAKYFIDKKLVFYDDFTKNKFNKVVYIGKILFYYVSNINANGETK